MACGPKGGCGGGGASPIKWGRVTATSPLTIQISGDVTTIEIDLADSGITWAVGDNAVLLEVASRRWVAVSKFA